MSLTLRIERGSPWHGASPLRSSFLNRFARCWILFLTVTLLTSHEAAGAEWKPVTPEERNLTRIPGAPGAPAVCLFSEVFTDDVLGREHHYIRIKVLTDAGRSQGNLTIPYVKDRWDLRALLVRVIQPDGTITENPGTPTDTVIVRYRRFKTSAKTLPIPSVQVGTIIEYQYDIEWGKHIIYADPWVVRGDLYTLRATFERRPNRIFNLRWFASRMPKGVDAAVAPDGNLRLELANVPAAQVEDFMPPEGETRPRIDFRYYFGRSLGTDPDVVWKQIAKSAREGIERYLSQDHGLDRFLAETVRQDDAAEVRIRKLYDRIQAMRNLSYEDGKSAVESKREKLKDAENVGDVIKHGYGWHGDLDLLFFALVRRAGFQAWFLDVARRDGELFFDPRRSMSISDLPGRAVLVRLNDKDLFLDPGTVLLPFNSLPWGETSVKAVRLDTENGGLLTMPDTHPGDAVVERKAKLRLDERGAIEGDVTVVYSGLEAFNRRFDARLLDETAKRETLEKELRGWIPRSAEVRLQNQPEWLRTDNTLTAEFRVRINDWATTAGQRMLCPEGIFSGGEQSVFQSENRLYDLYFPYPSETRDSISVSLPPLYEVEAVPAAKSRDLAFLSYKAFVQKNAVSVEISRRLTLGRISLPVTSYGGVHAFYQDLRSADESQIVLTAAKPNASNP